MISGSVYWQADTENAAGQLTRTLLSDGTLEVTTAYDEATGTLRRRQSRHLPAGTTLQHLRFTFDQAYNLTGRLDYLADGGQGLYEVFTYDAMNRLEGARIKAKPYGPLAMRYDATGNIAAKSDVGDYRYEGAQPHAVTAIAPAGTALPATEQTITYTGFGKVATLTEGAATMTITYGTAHERKRTVTTFAGTTLTKRYIGGLYEEEENAGGAVRQVHYIPAGGEAVAVLTMSTTDTTLHYLLRDHLGSVTALVTPAGAVAARYSYDAWGRRRDPDTWRALSGTASPAYARGFTGHEHLPLFGLINMNGRVYDPLTGRFLSTDPRGQFMNPYSYCGGNPLNCVDPDGEFAFIPLALVMAKSAAIGALNYSIATSGQGWDWGGFGKSLVTGAIMGALSGGIGLGVSSGLDALQVGNNTANFIGGFSGNFAAGIFANGGLPTNPGQLTVLAGTSAVSGLAYSNPLSTLKKPENPLNLDYDYLLLPEVPIEAARLGNFPPVVGKDLPFHEPHHARHRTERLLRRQLRCVSRFLLRQPDRTALEERL